MNNNEKYNTHRCPWCGELGKYPERHARHTNPVRCRHCDNEYSIYQINSIFFLFEFTPPFILCWALHERFHPVIIVLIFAFWVCILKYYPEKPLRRECDGNSYRKKHPVEYSKDFKAKIRFHKNKMCFYQKMYCLFPKKHIYPICFIDENNTPVSSTVCVLFEKYNRFKKKGTLSYLPLGEKFENVEKGMKFYIFDDKKIIGEGVTLTSLS